MPLEIWTSETLERIIVRLGDSDEGVREAAVATILEVLRRGPHHYSLSQSVSSVRSR